MEKELKKAIKAIMKYDFYDKDENPIEINLRQNKTEDLLKKAFMNAILSIEYVKDDEDSDLRTVDDDELAIKLGDKVVDLFTSLQEEGEAEEAQEEADEEEYEEPPEEDENPTDLDLELEEALEEVVEKPKKERKKVATGFDKYGFRTGSKCSLIMSLLEKNKYSFRDLQKELEGKTNIDPRKIVRVVNSRDKYSIARNESGIYIVEEK